MRCTWTLATLVLLVTVVTGSERGRAAGGSCAQALPQAPAGFPAPIVVTTGCGRFRLEPAGRVVYEGPWTSPVPPEALSYSMDLTWYGLAHGHLLIGRGQTQLWRSHDTYPGSHAGDVGAVVLGRRGLAFSYYEGRRSRLYLAGYEGAERVIARGETPLAFTGADELVTWRERGRELLLRARDGRLDRSLAADAIDLQVDPESKAVLFRTGRWLFVFDGVCVRDLVSLRRLGLQGVPTLESLGRLISVHDRRRLVVLDYDGRLVASTALPRRPKRADGISSSVEANATGTAVAFTATSGNTAYGSPGLERVYLLAAGARRARPVFAEELVFKVCERIASLGWHGRWLLYADTEQRAAVVDSSGEARPVELGPLIARLPGFRSDDDGIFDIAWA